MLVLMSAYANIDGNVCANGDVAVVVCVYVEVNINNDMTVYVDM